MSRLNSIEEVVDGSLTPEVRDWAPAILGMVARIIQVPKAKDASLLERNGKRIGNIECIAHALGGSVGLQGQKR